MSETRKLKPGREHDIPGSRAKDEWPPLSKCCNAEIWRESSNGCDKEKIISSNIYYCKKCGDYLGFKTNETKWKE